MRQFESNSEINVSNGFSSLAGSHANFVANLKKAMYRSVGFKIFAQTMLKVKIAFMIDYWASQSCSFSY